MSRGVAALPLLLVAAISLGVLASCGGGAKAKVYTSPEAPQVQLPKGRQFLGTGSKDIGTVVVRKASVLHWASDSPVFQLWDAGQRIRVRTQDHAGSLKVAAGTYPKLSVIAFGRWVITISPG